MKNSEIRIVFQPNDRDLYGGRRRFGVGSRSLFKYITDHNSQTVFTNGVEKALQNKFNRQRLRFRKYGIVDIYLK